MYIFRTLNSDEMDRYSNLDCNSFIVKASRDLYFSYYQYKVYAGKSKNGSNICSSDLIDSIITSKNNELERCFSFNLLPLYCSYWSFKVNVGSFISEVYIPDCYNTINSDTFNIEIKATYVDIEEDIRKLFSDVLLRVYGGRNLASEIISDNSFFEIDVLYKHLGNSSFFINIEGLVCCKLMVRGL